MSSAQEVNLKDMHSTCPFGGLLKTRQYGFWVIVSYTTQSFSAKKATKTRNAVPKIFSQAENH